MKATHQPPTTGDTTPADLLRGAALYIERHGWNQGAFFQLPTRHRLAPACAMGALRIAATGTTDSIILDDVFTQVLAAQAILANHLEPDYDHTTDLEADLNFEVISDWNDDGDRTAAEVVTALRDAADTWDRLHPTGGENA
ncbi:DUF6197 family protein [Polymorphospora lycopeni]|uniref:DUF6197 family protein n=1 Tax=Polymorphospora lycopeni TaxID=3140240 RepID=A0ABV5CWA3_9ACTN